MASPVKLYQREMHGHLGFFATWLPIDWVDVGDVGVLDGGKFTPMTSLRELGIPCEVKPRGKPAYLRHVSSKGINVSVSTGGTVEALVKAEIAIDFSTAGAFVFETANLQQRSFENRAEIAEGLFAAYDDERWQKDWVVVNAVYSADVATILVSVSKSAGLVLAGEVGPPHGEILLAGLEGKLSVTSRNGAVVDVVAKSGARPLYSCLRIKTGFFGGRRIGPVRGHGGRKPSLRDLCDSPSIDDLLES